MCHMVWNLHLAAPPQQGTLSEMQATNDGLDVDQGYDELTATSRNAEWDVGGYATLSVTRYLREGRFQSDVTSVE